VATHVAKATLFKRSPDMSDVLEDSHWM